MFAFLSTMFSWLPGPLPVLCYAMFLFLVVVALWHIIQGVIELVKAVISIV